MFWSVGWSLLRAEGFFCNLDILYGGLGKGKLLFLIKKNFFFQLLFIFNFWSLKPWIRIGSGSGLVSSIELWIRIREKMNTDPKPWFWWPKNGKNCPPVSGSGFRNHIPIHWPDWIRTRNTGNRNNHKTVRLTDVPESYSVPCVPRSPTAEDSPLWGLNIKRNLRLFI